VGLQDHNYNSDNGSPQAEDVVSIKTQAQTSGSPRMSGLKYYHQVSVSTLAKPDLIVNAAGFHVCNRPWPLRSIASSRFLVLSAAPTACLKLKNSTVVCHYTSTADEESIAPTISQTPRKSKFVCS
jgi:hypothetical protein